MRSRHQLLLALNRAWASHDLDFFATDEVTLHIDLRVASVSLAADELVTFLNRHDAFHLAKGCECFQRMILALIANGAHNSPFDTPHDMRFVAQFFDLF